MNKHAAPDFAMSFTHEAVLLERRDGTGWQTLGQVRFAGGNITASLRMLREQAPVPGSEADTLLVIPDDQILYTRLTVTPGSDIRAAIARALEGITSCTSDELVFDWCPDCDGRIDSLRVAVVARKTLEEAEEFARQQGFRPTGFVARPDDDRFDGQPDFGVPAALRPLPALRPFSKPDLHQAAITSDRIEIPEPPTDQPMISRIVPHRLPDAPSPSPSDTSPSDTSPRPAAVVIRHGGAARTTGPGALERMSERARAVHARAAAARAQRKQIAADRPQGTPHPLVQRFRRRRPGTLGVLMGGLLALLLLTFLVFGDPPTPQEMAQRPADDSIPPTVQAAEPQTAGPQTAGPQSVAAAPAPANSASDDDSSLPRADSVAASPVLPDDSPAPAPQDALDAALAEAMASPEPDRPAPAAPVDRAAAGAPADADSANFRPAAAVASDPPAAALPPLRSVSQSLSRSARPPRAAVPARASAPAAPDARPIVPTDPQPYPQRGEAQPSRVTAIRPPARPAPRPQIQPSSPPSAAPEQAAPAGLPPRPPAGASRPPARPADLTLREEGSASEENQPTRLTQAEEQAPRQVLRDLRTAQAGAVRLSTAERGVVIRLAQARPQRKPLSIAGPSRQAVEQAVQQAAANARPPHTPEDLGEADAPSTNRAGNPSLVRSARPTARPDSAPSPRAASGAGNPSLSREAVEAAVAAAVDSAAAAPGGLALTALSSSAIPPRRASRDRAPARTAPTGPSAEDLRAAAQAQQAEAERLRLEEQRRMDAELQAQAEARARARAAEDARAEAQARAQAEARARAQAEAEARAAAARKQNYAPPEAENEPEIASQIPEGRTAPTVAAAATVKDGIQINRTQIIGTVGAGKASRALVRLSNGRVLTLRLGDRINGGTITDIGDSRITYTKGGRPQQLSVLGGK